MTGPAVVPESASPLADAARGMRCGVDVTDVARISALVDRRPAFLFRVLTPAERRDCVRGDLTLDHPVASQRIAARFAAKEAARKALGTHLGWRDVEVRTIDGAPRLWVNGEPATAAVSLAHDAGVAIAFVVVPAGG